MGVRRTWLLGAVVVALVATGAAAGWAVLGGEDPYDHSLQKYADKRGEPNRYVNLGDGKAQLSIGSPDSHRVVVQWRDPDGHGWTAPQTVWTDKRNTFIDTTVRFGGGTVATVATFTPDTSNEDDSIQVSVLLVCRRLHCDTQRLAGPTAEPQVTPNGRTAYLTQTAKGAWLWTRKRGIYLAPWSGHPGFRYHVTSPSTPVLAPDGSLRIVTSRPSRRTCTFTLLAGKPETATLAPVADRTERLRGDSRSDCSSYLDTFSSDWVSTHPTDHHAPDFWFVREGGTWTTTRTDPSGLQVIPERHDCCGSATAGFLHWNDLTFGSPDGHRIQLQYHLLGQERWSRPILLDGAEPGYRCTWMDIHSVGENGTAIVMTCHSGPSRDEYRGDAYALAVSTDLRHWRSTFVTGVRRDPSFEDGKAVVGSVSWTPGGGFVQR